MESIFLAFITGLTTGGLSCLAVQGGLLASSLSTEIERTFDPLSKSLEKSRKGRKPVKPRLALPILLFLIAKLTAYTILGFFLGWIGQAFQLSTMARAILQIGIGVFMLGNALRMLKVHPVFRFFAIEPPAFLRKKIREAARESGNSSYFGPVWLGLLTVLIPCGVTQAMMAVALGSGNPLQGAALMFAFTLGTSPVFFAVSYFATKLGEKFEKHFVRITAIIILILALVTVNSGLNLAGSPVSIQRVFASNSSKSVSQNQELDSSPGLTSNGAGESTSIPGDPVEVVTLFVLNNGYSPNTLHVKANQAFQLELITDNVRSCSRAFVIPKLGVEEILDSTGSKLIPIPAQASGTSIPFSCSMGMYTGTIIFDL